MKRKTNQQHRPDSAKRKQARAESSSAPIIREGVDLTQLEMAPGQSVHLTGSAVLEVTAGCLAVYGALLTPHSGPFTIHAPTKFGRAVQLAAVAAATADVEPPCQPSQSAVQAVLQPLAAAAVYNDNNTSKQQQQQQKGYAVIDAAAAGGGGEGEGGGSGLPAWQVPAPWSQAVGDLVAAAAAASGHVSSSSSSMVPLAVAVTGSKGCGKSAFARLLVNALLTQQQGAHDDHGVVAYLDLDPGQPEFTPPGLVSLQLLRRPVFGPPHMQHQQPLLSYFQGDTSSQSEPGRYLQAVQALVYRYTQISAADLAANISTAKAITTSAARDADGCVDVGGRLSVLPPLVINTPGWITGLGLDLLAEVLRCAQPTHVVQLQTPNPKKNLPAAAWWFDGSLSATAAAAAAGAGRSGAAGAAAAAGGGSSSMMLPVVLQVPSVSGAVAGDTPSSAAAGGGGAGCDSMMSAAPSGDTTQTAGGKGGGSSVKGVSAAAVRNLMWLSWAERVVAAENSSNPQQLPANAVGQSSECEAAAAGGGGGGFAAAEDFAGAAAALAAAVPMVVSLADVAVELLHAQVAPSELPVALNGAVVGLAAAAATGGGAGRVGGGVSAAPQPQQQQQPQQQLCECLGLGLVRAVDGPAGQLYLLTDLSEQQLQRVDTLQVGRLELPDKLLECRGFASPYQGLFCLSSTATGAGQIKSRNNLLRASQLLR